MKILEFRAMKLRFIGILIILIQLFGNGSFAQEYNIVKFGAIADGKSLNTEAIQNAINQAHADGGGIVYFPRGEYLSGSLILKSNVGLYLDKKAVLLGSAQPEDYLQLQRWKALILADSANNISISGKGTIDGQGAELALRIDSLFYAGKIDSADYNLKDKRPKADIRPQLIEFVNCSRIQIKDVELKSAASWVQSYFRCSNLLIEGITVDSDTYWNNDGIDIIDSRAVVIRDVDINASDDGICLKSYAGGYDGPQDWSIFCEDILIENCKVRSSASAIKFGTSSYRGFHKVVVRNIKIYDTFRSAIAIESVHNGVIEDVLIEKIRAKNTGNAIFVRLGGKPTKDRQGAIRNLTIRDVKVNVPFGMPDEDYVIRGPALPYFHNVIPSSITGLENLPLEEITLENIEISYPGRGNAAYANLPISRIKDVPEYATVYPEFSMFGELPAWGLYVRHIGSIQLKNIKIKIKDVDYRPALVFDDVNELEIESLNIKGDDKEETIIFNEVEKMKIESP